MQLLGLVIDDLIININVICVIKLFVFVIMFKYRENSVKIFKFSIIKINNMNH